jgi:Kef-type K+ transport system membrane component KefB
MAMPFIDMVEREYGEKGICMTSFGLLLMLAFVAMSIGLDLIVGAFAAGVALSEVREREQIHQNFKPFIHVFATLFFVIMGTHVDLSLLNPMKQENHAVFTLSMILIIIAIAGKILSGMIVPKGMGDRWVVGIGMIPRGEVGLIYANLGITSGILLREQFGALVLMVMVTTIVGPMVLRWVLRN